ncbi:MAG: metallopeptidase TldD-related protein [Candidatus Stygibacter australis]|nr:metallopeptidase TldD-related protein [Candidatus Stygibacter australis]MDP8322756.1 metallopeptidase TldD-related protein [Candidatus Stygibacter australis]
MILKFKEKLVNICNEFTDLKFQFHLRKWHTDFLRFYQSQTNYNISKSSLALSATVHKGKRYYDFSLDNPTEEALREKINEVVKFIDDLPEDPDYVDIEANINKTAEKPKPDNRETVDLEKKIEILQQLAKAVAPFDYKIYGTFICNYNDLYIVNSNGVDKHEMNSPIALEVKAVNQKTEVTVLETFGGENFKSFDLPDFRDSLVKKAEAGNNEIVDLEPGKYPVVLAPRCIAEYFMYLMNSVSARSLDSKNSFFEGKLDQKLFPENVSITDNPQHPDMMQFDYTNSGHPYENLKIIENGVFRNFMVSNYYAHKLKMKETGSEASALIMDTGDKTLAEMIAGIKKGIYVSSLHYMNFINPKETSVTGLTRDGTFLIEDGKITKVINNLRFTEKIVRIIENITEIENKAVTIPFSQNYGHFGIDSYRMPHVTISSFNITSSTGTI